MLPHKLPLPQGEGWGERSEGPGIKFKGDCLNNIPSSWPSPGGRRNALFIGSRLAFMTLQTIQSMFMAQQRVQDQ